MPLLPFSKFAQRHLTTGTTKFKHKTRNSSRSLSSIIQSCKTMGILKQIHAHMITTDQIRDMYKVTKLLESYAVSFRNINIASRIFRGIESPDSYVCTTMIRGSLEAKDTDKAIQFYGEMRLRGIELNRFTFLFMLKAYGLKQWLEEGKVIHGKIMKVGFCCDVYINNALVNLYSKCGDIDASYLVFIEMQSDSVVVWNTMINGFFICGNTESGLKMFDEMPERNIGSWNMVIGGYCKLGHVDSARSLFDIMPERDLVSWGSMISGYVQNGKAIEALNLFNQMQSAGVNPDCVTLTTLLSACAQIGALDVGMSIHAFAKNNKLLSDIFLVTSLVDMYAKCGCIDTASELFHSMPHKNLCSWNAILSGLATHGCGFDALELFKGMECANVEPNDVTFVAVLTACSHVGSVDEGWKQFHQMRNKFNIMPKIEHYGCMVDILCRQGCIKEAKDLIKTMPIEPNVVILGALLNACRMFGYYDTDYVMKHLQKIDSEERGCYTLLSNIYADRRRWTEVEKTRNLVRGLGPENKVPGCSSIEVSGVVHEFFVRDRSEINYRSVSQVVERLTTHLEAENFMPIHLCHRNLYRVQ